MPRPKSLLIAAIAVAILIGAAVGTSARSALFAGFVGVSHTHSGDEASGARTESPEPSDSQEPSHSAEPSEKPEPTKASPKAEPTETPDSDDTSGTDESSDHEGSGGSSGSGHGD
jgi:hypothetical protein